MANLHLIIGEDDYLVSETAKKIIGDGTGLEVVDSLSSTNAELQLADIRAADASFRTPPFLDPRKVTWWKNVHFLPGGGRRAAAEEVKVALENLAKRFAASPLPENQHFIISGPRLMKGCGFANALATAAETVTFPQGKPRERIRNALRRVTELAAETNLRFEPGAAELFVSRVGTDVRSLLSELAKLRDYLGGESRAIAAADIAEVTSQGAGVEPEIWAITDALGERSLVKCLSAARRFEQEKNFAVLVSTVVEKFFRQLIDVNKGTAGEMPDFVQRKMSGFLDNWTLHELRVARWRFLMLRERAVSSSGSANVLVLTELARVCRRPSARR